MKTGDYHFLEYGGFRLPYRVWGHGGELLLAFHGYGRSSEDYRPYAAELGAQYTLIAFDFFYHGPMAANPETPMPAFNSSQMAGLVERLLWERKKVNCSLLAYSQGGRLVLGILHRIPHRVNKVVLVSPDGLRPNRMRKFISKTPVGRWTGRWLVAHRSGLHSILKILAATGFIRPNLRNFYVNSTREKKDRFRIYHIWMAMKDFEIHPKLIDHYLNSRNFRMVFVMGQYDSVIPVKWAEAFIRKMRKKPELIVLPCGHDLLKEVQPISRILLEAWPRGKSSA
jgi:pimeloyl-ACP methyl ester carboxylesterase